MKLHVSEDAMSYIVAIILGVIAFVAFLYVTSENFWENC